MMLAQRGRVEDLTQLEARGYQFDLKVDGVRCLAEVNGGVVRLTSRRGVDMTTRYPEVATALAELYPSMHVILDGEIAVDDERGLPSWPLTHKRDAQQSRAHWWAQHSPATYYAFDILQLSVRDMRRWTFENRRKVLAGLAEKWPPNNGIVRMVLTGMTGSAMWTIVEQYNLEGLVAKNPKSPYRTDRRSSDWVKIKRTSTVSCLVGGFDPGEGSRASTFGALHLYLIATASLRMANEAPGDLVAVGKVGSGFSDKELRTIKERLDAQIPTIVEVSYLDVSPDGKLRQPVFERLRIDVDLAVTDCTLEQLQLHSSH